MYLSFHSSDTYDKPVIVTLLLAGDQEILSKKCRYQQITNPIPHETIVQFFAINIFLYKPYT